MKYYEGIPKLFIYSPFLVQLLLREGRFGQNAHTQIHTSTIYNRFSKTAYTQTSMF